MAMALAPGASLSRGGSGNILRRFAFEQDACTLKLRGPETQRPVAPMRATRDVSISSSPAILWQMTSPAICMRPGLPLAPPSPHPGICPNPRALNPPPALSSRNG
eukprot:3053158-Rhodomonas_salina.4